MTENMNYLSDEELELLIADVEQNELVVAPPDMLEEILKRVLESEADAIIVSDIKKTDNNRNADQATKFVTNMKEFRRYCFKICASVAAAVVLVFVLPALADNPATQNSEQEKLAVESRYATKEEALSDRGHLAEMFGGVNIFSGDRELGIFNGKNGG